ncbi:MAG: PKD domain-containing protein [Dysgonomonas sp.]
MTETTLILITSVYWKTIFPDDSKVSVLRGNEVHFKDLSQNNPTSWQWTFEGGEPATSAEQNPVVKYNNEGVYDVTLVVTNADGTDQKVRTDYVTVTEITPKASFDYPAVGYCRLKRLYICL